MSFSITLKRSFNCKPERLFEILTTRSELTRAFGGDSSIAKKVGGRVSLFDGWTKGKVVEIDKPNFISFTWNASDFPENQGETLVNFTITEIDDKSSLELFHSGFTVKEQRDSHETGWDEFFFDPIKDLI